MSDDKKLDKRLGLAVPFSEALERFARVTRQEVEEAEKAGKPQGELVPDGEADSTPFKGIAIRRVFHESEWWFSVVDVCEALTGTSNPRRYWSDLKRQMSEKEGASELYDEIVQLKMTASDGKLRETDAASPETIFRIVQSIQ